MILRLTFFFGVILSLALLAPASALAFTPAFEDDDTFWKIDIEQLEYLSPNNSLYLEGEGRIGNDDHQFSMPIRINYDIDDGIFEESELHFLYMQNVSHFFDVGGGIRQDIDDFNRTYGVLRLNGLAPQWIEVDANMFISTAGIVAGRLEGRYELYLSQKTIFHPLIELDFAFGDDEKIGTYTGINELTIGGRVSYAVHPSIFPYIGINWEKKLGKASHFARMNGEDADGVSFVIGTKMKF